MYRISVLLISFCIFSLGLYFFNTLIPNSISMRSYLGPITDLRVKMFLQNKYREIPDDEIGWIMKPKTKAGKFILDNIGSRSTSQDLDWLGTKNKAALFGDSLINGFTHINNSQTINAYLENDSTKWANFGTNLHGLDQTYLLIRRLQAKYNFKKIIVGISSDSGKYLRSSFLPFSHDKKMRSVMPYLKPRFYLENNKLNFKPLDISMYKKLYTKDFIKDQSGLSDSDDSDNFSNFLAGEFLPFSLQPEIISTNDELDNLDLLFYISKLIYRIDKSKIVFLILPRPEKGDQLKLDRIKKILIAANINFMDGSQIFKNIPYKSAWTKDGHYKSLINELIAEYISSYLENEKNEKI